MCMSKQYFTALTLFLILIAPLASSESNDEFIVDNSEPDMATGDYFLYDLDMSGLLNSMQDEDIDEVRENSNTGMRMEYGGDSCLQTGWDDCGIELMSWELNLTMIFSSGSGIDNDQAEMLMKMESTEVFSENKSEDTTITTIDMWFSIDGEAYHNEIVTTEISISTAIGASEPENVMTGDTWITEKMVETTSNEKSRMNAEAWEYEDEVIESENITTNYNAESISNVYIGNTSYQSLKIRSQDLGSEEMGYGYLVNTGIPIKMEYYENGSLQMIATLTDYSWTNEPMPTSQDNAIVEDELPGFTVFPALMSSLFALYFVARKE